MTTLPDTVQGWTWMSLWRHIESCVCYYLLPQVADSRCLVCTADCCCSSPVISSRSQTERAVGQRKWLCGMISKFSCMMSSTIYCSGHQNQIDSDVLLIVLFVHCWRWIPVIRGSKMAAPASFYCVCVVFVFVVVSASVRESDQPPPWTEVVVGHCKHCHAKWDAIETETVHFVQVP